MRRRTFLELLAAGSLAGTVSLAQEIVPRQPQRVLLTIAGIGAGTDAGALGALLAALVAGAVPVNLVVETGEGPDRLHAGGEIGRLVLRYLHSFPGLVEAVSWCPDLGQLAPYQAARKAQEAREALTGMLYALPVPDQARSPLLSLACTAPADSGAASATLASGFRNVLALPETSATVGARLDRHGVMTLLGGERLRVEDAAAALSRNRPGFQRHVILSAAEIAGTPADVLLASAQAVGRVLKDAALDLRMVSVLASDVQMRTEVAFRHRVAVHLLEPKPGLAPEIAGFTAFQDMLKAEGIPFSTGPAAAGGKAGLSYWIPLAAPGDDAFDRDQPFGAFAGEPLAPARGGAVAAKDTRFGIVTRPVSDAGSAGLTSQAELNIPVLAAIGVAGEDPVAPGFHLDIREDGLLLISAAALPEPAMRTAILLAIRRIMEQAETRLMPLETYCAEVLPKDPLLPTLLLTRTRGLKSPGLMPAAGGEEREALLEDARSAWNYFAQSTNRSTGLCPATTIMGTRPIASHLSVSMWEAGSHLNALIAAVDLGLISDEDFTARCKHLLKTVERASRKRLVLPPETINTQTGKGTTRFNSYDTGRLLIALHRLNSHRLALPGIEALVASWDFPQVIIDRRLHSYRERQMIDDFASNYADYAASGLRLWGMDVASPFDDFAGVASADEEAALIATTVSFGPLGAEPCCLHLLEMPFSPAASFLADCLDAIQSRLAEASGMPAAPSETPIDREPWFTYQGFDLRKLADPWIVEFTGKDEDPDADGTALSLRATSAKGAYLWHALRPNAHSARLVKTLRRKARKEFGFDSALYHASQTTTEGYADLNTNAMILEAIAHILLDGRSGHQL